MRKSSVMIQIYRKSMGIWQWLLIRNGAKTHKIMCVLSLSLYHCKGITKTLLPTKKRRLQRCTLVLSLLRGLVTRGFTYTNIFVHSLNKQIFTVWYRIHQNKKDKVLTFRRSLASKQSL